MKEKFIDKKFTPIHSHIITEAERICDDFRARGYDLTLRQIYYQFVGHDLFPDQWAVKLPDGALTKNHLRNYKKLGKVLSKARRAGLLDWNSMVDRTRSPNSRSNWDDVGEFLDAYADIYNVHYWDGQPAVPECWVEKDALIGILEGVADPRDVTSFASRGYPSDSALYDAAQRIKERWDDSRQTTAILHFADHDPSGVDMTRSISETLTLFGCGDRFKIDRIGLNIDQTEGLPPSPAKVTDSRTNGYVKRFGTNDAWELDAIDPDELSRWVEEAIEPLIVDPGAFEARKELEKLGRAQIRQIASEHQS